MAIIAHVNMFSRLLLLSSQFYKIAKKLDDVISAMNLQDNIREFLLSIPDSEKGFYIGALKKNPKLNLDELKQIEIKIKNDYDENEQDSIDYITADSPKEIKEWLIIQFNKLKTEHNLSSKQKLRNFTDIKNFLKENVNNRTSFLAKFYYQDLQKIDDWFRAVRPQIASYSAREAINASDTWHKEIAERGKNKGYQEGTSNIVYGPNWQNPEFNGWTIRKIKTANDLDVEGNKMNHCVGSYSDKIDQESVDIYSLRDPSNNPHVTMGSNFGGYSFFQIKGNSNQPPKQKYKEMIREWFNSLKEIGKTIKNSEKDNLSEIWKEAKNQIIDLIDGVDSYGSETEIYNKKSVKNILHDFENLSKNNNGSIDEIVKLCAYVLHEKDKLLLERILDDAKTHKGLLGSTEFIFQKKWESFSSVGKDNLSNKMSALNFSLNEDLKDVLEMISYPDQRDYWNNNKFDQNAFDQDALIWENKKEFEIEKYKNEKLNTFPFNFYYGLIEELKRINASDPIPRESWMQDYYYDRF